MQSVVHNYAVHIFHASADCFILVNAAADLIWATADKPPLSSWWKRWCCWCCTWFSYRWCRSVRLLYDHRPSILNESVNRLYHTDDTPVTAHSPFVSRPWLNCFHYHLLFISKIHDPSTTAWLGVLTPACCKLSSVTLFPLSNSFHVFITTLSKIARCDVLTPACLAGLYGAWCYQWSPSTTCCRYWIQGGKCR